MQIDVLEGSHTLTVVAVDIEGNKETKTQKTIGDNKPSLTVTTDGEKFIIDATDDEGLTKIEFKLNSNDTITEDISGQECHKEIDLVTGVNKLVVKVQNSNGISETKKVKYSKE